MRIDDYALIGDCQSAALVGNDGSMDWLCLPRFDSGACFAALLGSPENGRWKIAPTSHIRRVHRRYQDDTLILETTFESDDGVMTLTDFMPPRADFPQVVRMVRGDRGCVAVRSELIIRFDYGSVVPWVQKTDGGIRATAGPDTLYCTGDAPLTGVDFRTFGEFSVREGEVRNLGLTWMPTQKAVQVRIDAPALLRETRQWWQEWVSRNSYRGQWREAVTRSLITLKALTYAPTGGVLAAPTTSLPEDPGGQRNWDYRYCWLRDATFTLYALTSCGYVREAIAWREWLINAVAGSPGKLQVMYGVAGERRLSETTLPWLRGFGGARPVRIGNDAYRQHQLDVYGEVMDTLHFSRNAGMPPDESAWQVQSAIMKFLEGDWRKADSGIWEVRGRRRHFTHSKVMAWVAFDRAVKAVERSGLSGPVDRWRRVRDRIHAEILKKGYDPGLNTFVQSYGSKEADASLLMMPLVGFLPATDPRVLGTVDFIRRTLEQDGLLARYRPETGVDGFHGAQGAFLLCSFWLADNLALQGQQAAGRELFERLLALRNDVGLLSEQYDPIGHCFLGNFPQAFSHVGLINTALNLSDHGPGKQRAAECEVTR